MQHEISIVSSGYRLCLVYSLCHTGFLDNNIAVEAGDDLPSAEKHAQAEQSAISEVDIYHNIFSLVYIKCLTAVFIFYL